MNHKDALLKPINSNTTVIGVIGLGYVGLPLAVEFGKHYATVGFDIKRDRIEALKAGHDETLEVNSEELAQSSRLSYACDIEALRQCNIYIVTVPTPINQHKRPDLTPLIKASETIGKVLKQGDIVIYESTVYPGATEEDCIPVLEKVSGLTFNQDFFAGYSPERINPGDKEHRVTTIKKVTSGSTPEVADQVDALYASIITAGTHKASSIRVAEAAKVIENTQRDLNIALMNELSLLFQKLNIDTLEVLEAAGTKWNFLPFRPGLVGGHCIGVDPYYLTDKAQKVGYQPEIILAGRRINDNMAAHVAQNVIRMMLKSGLDVPRCKVGVMGVTFKENCPDIRNSKVADIVAELQQWGVQVVVTDPWANSEEVEHEYGFKLGTISTEEPVDALIVAVGHKEYTALTTDAMRGLVSGNKPIIADIKCIFDRKNLSRAGFAVFRL